MVPVFENQLGPGTSQTLLDFVLTTAMQKFADEERRKDGGWRGIEGEGKAMKCSAALGSPAGKVRGWDVGTHKPHSTAITTQPLQKRECGQGPR